MLIELRGAKKAFKAGRKKERVLFRNADMLMDEGELVALTGPSGNGKSTILNILSGFMDLDEGRYLYDGEDVTNNFRALDIIRRRDMAVIPQGLLLADQLTAGENIGLAVKAKKIDGVSAKIKNMAIEFGVDALLDKKVKQLSLGERQRVAIIRALVLDPKVILADEPSSALNEELKDIVFNHLQNLAKRGVSVLVITHDKSVAKLCTREYAVDNARVSPVQTEDRQPG